MNCENYQELLSEFIDGELDDLKCAEMKAHFADCQECDRLRADFAEILALCDAKSVKTEIAPGSSAAMWTRINNVIESEIQAKAVKKSQEETKKGWFAEKIWSFSFSQIAASMAGIALISSVITFVGLQNSSNSAEISDNSAPPSFFRRALSKVGLAETPREARERKMRERQALIDYWNRRVAAKRPQWDKNLRAAFDRNLSEIDQVVNEYTLILEQNPRDDLSSEMLDSALNDKVELLREFSDL